jgi:hypothetical protein
VTTVVTLLSPAVKDQRQVPPGADGDGA